MLRSKPYKPLRSYSMDRERKTKVSKIKIFLGAGVILCFVGFVALALSLGSVLTTKDFGEEISKENWEAQLLSTNDLRHVSNSISMQRLKEILNQILIPRVPGSNNITIVAANIVSRLQDLGWKLTHDSFREKPPNPYPMTSFRSLIATHNPKVGRRLILACHHDSKVTPEGFLGATDSAVPCSIMIELAYALNHSLNALKRKQQSRDLHGNDITLQLLFLDGEEAFVEWNDRDSIYGARHLAAKWKRTNKLDSIDLFVLLDLIGTHDTVIRNYKSTQTPWFDHAADLEARMTLANILPDHLNLFQSHHRYNQYRIEDDHLPFLRQGVPVFHMIQAPFSPVWHTMDDNYDALDFDRIELFTKILTNFVAEYLHLDVTPPPTAT